MNESIKGNVCPARIPGKQLGGMHIGLPHEPIEALDGTPLLPIDPQYCDGWIRACVHCGSLYLEVKR